MTTRVRLLLAATAITAIVVAAISIDRSGEGGDGEELTPPPETVDAAPKLPRGWIPAVNQEGGFSVAVPPGWSQQSSGNAMTLTAPSSAVVVRVTTDRSREALLADLPVYAEGIAARLEPEGVPEPIADPPGIDDPSYEVAAATVTSPPSGGQQNRRLEVFVVRRAELAVYPVLVASDARVKQAALDPVTRRLVRSLRGRPATPAAG